MKKALLLFFLIATCGLPFQEVFACTTPVFQYAMQRWGQDYYHGLVIYDGSLTEEDKAILEKLQGAANHDIPLNLSLEKIDIRAEKRTVKKLLGKNIPEQLSALVIWYPMQMGFGPPVWTGSLTEPVIDKLIQSPVSEEIGDHLLRGVPVVWVLVQSGNSRKDQAAAKFLEEELNTLKQDILKDPTFQPHFEHITDLPDLFPIVVIPGRQEAEEDILLSTMMDYYPGPEGSEEPAIFPVFGRGRALGRLEGNEIDTRTLQDVIAFLLHPCSCQIKMANPGFDLLLRSDWNTLLARFDLVTIRPQMAGVMPDTSGQFDFIEMVDLTSQRSGFFSSRILSTTGIIIGAVVLLVILTSIFIIKRK